MGTCSLDNSAKTLGAPSKPPVVRKPGLSDTGSRELFGSPSCDGLGVIPLVTERLAQYIYLNGQSAQQLFSAESIRGPVRPRDVPVPVKNLQKNEGLQRGFTWFQSVYFQPIKHLVDRNSLLPWPRRP